MLPKRKYRNCPQSPLEFKDVELQKYWLNLFDELEEIYFKERHKIGTIVGDVVGQRTYDILKPILNLDHHAHRACLEEPDVVTPEDFRSLDRESLSEPSADESLQGENAEEWAEDEEEWDFPEEEEMEQGLTDTEETVTTEPLLAKSSELTLQGTVTSEVSSMFVDPGPPYPRDEEVVDDYTNPYLRFLRLPKVKAAIWQTKKDPIPTGLHEPDPNLNLQEKAALVTYMISKQFYDWFRSIGGTEVHSFSDKVLCELFGVGFDQLAAHALCSRMKEMPSVPTEVAVETNLPKADYRLALKREIARDSHAEKIPKKTIGFGNTIKYPDRWVPPHNSADTWFKCFRVRPEIASFSMVWQGITHMSSTKAFVHYLKERPQLPRPQYLKEMGMFDPKPASSTAGSSRKGSHGDDGSSSSSSLANDSSSESLAKYGGI